MNLFAHIPLLGFPFLALIFFNLLPASRAVLATYILGWLFLPQAGYALGGVPDYDKPAAIGIGALVGAIIFSPTPLLTVR